MKLLLEPNHKEDDLSDVDAHGGNVSGSLIEPAPRSQDEQGGEMAVGNGEWLSPDQAAVALEVSQRELSTMVSRRVLKARFAQLGFGQEIWVPRVEAVEPAPASDTSVCAADNDPPGS